MAHYRMVHPDPSEPPRPASDLAAVPPRGREWVEDDSGVYLAELAATLASHGGGASSAELALDLLLNEIVEQARLATTATGAAIALARDDEMVCRATTGANAPDLGVRLNTQSGLSGACFQTMGVQHCDDTESDPRVDAAACRELQVRSILVVPVLKGQELLGIFEIFSPRPSAFGDRDIQVLQALSRRIVENIRHAAAAEAAPRIRPDFSPPSEDVSGSQSELVMPGILFGSEQQDVTAGRRDYWSSILIAVVVMLALLLGWMVGRVGWRGATSVAKTRAPVTLPSQRAASASPAVAPDATPVANPATTAAPSTPKTRSVATSSPAGGLVVYEQGRVVFQMPPSKESRRSGTELASLRSPQEATDNHSDVPANPLPVAPETASTYLIRQVDPEYPEEARQQHIQGAVVFKALVGRDGAVRGLTVVSGDAQLAPAAATAVRQWRFRPYRQNGRTVGFETQITVNFTLP